MGEFNLLRFMERAEWMADANCRGLNPETFMFPEDVRTGIGERKFAKAKEICRACDVQAECLAYALNNNEEGVWAATTFWQRRRIRRSVAPNTHGPIPPPQRIAAV